MDNQLVKSNRSLKIRLYPTKEQETLILKTFGCCRKIYNEHLQERVEFYANNILPIKSKTSKAEQTKVWKTFKPTTEKEFKVQYPYMKEVSSTALQQARINCDNAFLNFFKSLKGRIKGEKRGFPKGKSRKDSHQSYREAMPKKDALDFNHRKLTLPKIGIVSFKERQLPKWLDESCLLKSITISKSASNRYYASILYELPTEYKVQVNHDSQVSLGLDFSPSEMYIDSEGKSGKDYGYVAQKQAAKKQLKKLQRRFAKKQIVKKVCEDGITRKVSSQNREKARIKLTRLEEKIANRRKDWIEKETLRLVKFHKKVQVEDLNLKGISKFLRNAKNMNDTSWATFVSRLQDKGKIYGCEVNKIDRFYPSSQLCHNCNFQFKNLTLKMRDWTCPKCGEYHIRDVNAALNIRDYVPLEERELTPVESIEAQELIATLVAECLVKQEVGTGDSPQNVNHL